MSTEQAADTELQQHTAVAADEADNDEDDDDDDDVSEGIQPVSEQQGSRQQTRVYNCTTCSRSFNSRRDIVTHRYMHRENPVVFCSVCNKSFSTESAYRRHAASHSRKLASSQRPRKSCSQCDMQFDTMRQLSAHHAAKHVDQKRFICAICGSQFAWPENLRAHQRTHELDPHECEICGRRFVDATSLRVHTRNSHGPSSETPAQRKQHCCKVCGRSFQFDFSLRAHMKGHAQSPVAASLRRSKHISGKLTSTSTMPVTRTKYVHVDSQGVIDLGMDVAQTAANEPSEIIVEVYNTLDNNVNTQHTMDFSDVLDQSALLHSGTADHTDHENSSSKLVWYVKPDSHDDPQQQQQGSDDDDDNDDDGCDEVLKSAEQNSDHIEPATAATATAAADDDDDNGGDNGDNGGNDDVASDAAVAGLNESTHDVDDENIEHDDHDDVPSVINEPAPAVAVATETVVKSNVDYDDEDDDEDDDEIDWMDEEPPRRRAAPFIFRPTSSSDSSRRRVTRPREPFLFNCIMTDEKPFICVTCGECFRWEISLNIHQRIHTDGTFPNKSRRVNRRSATQQSSRRRAKSKQSKQTSATTNKSVARSCIVRHRRTSSDEEDDEFTFHVHADGPSEVSTNYQQLKRLVQRGRGHGRGQGRGRGRGRGEASSTSVAVIGHEHKPLSVSVSSGNVTVKRNIDTKLSTAGASGCNGVGCEQRPAQPSTVNNAVKSSARHKQLTVRASHVRQCSTVKSSARHKQVALRACHICRQCQRIVTCLAALKRHQRRTHFTTPLNCQFCSAQFTSRLDLRHHCQQLHDTVSVGSVVMKCRRCQRVFTDSKRLQCHYKLHQAAVKPAL